MLFSKKKQPSNLYLQDFADKIPYLNVDLKELLSRKVVDTTINEIVFKIKTENENNDISLMWERFIDELKEYNDLEKIHKTDTKYKSKYGKSIVGFDMWENHPIIWFADNIDGEAVRINGQKQWAISCVRTYASLNQGTPILRNKLIITPKNISYMFMGGFGVELKDSQTINEINEGKKTTQEVKEGWIPYQWAQLKIPAYIQAQFRVGTIEHNYGLLPAMEMLNKDFVDADGYDSLMLEGINQDVFYSDWWAAADIIEIFNGFIQFISSEMLYDQTRIIGTFTQQDINSLTGVKKDDASKTSIISKLKDRLANIADKTQGVVLQKLILRSIGGENSKIEKMQTTYKALEYNEALDKMIALFFKMSGYSWDGDSAKVYENVSQTMNTSRGVYESTKEKIVLFERQWKEFYCRLAFAWFKFNGAPFTNINEVKESFEKNVDFRIISNILQQENNDYQKVLELKQNGLISIKKALQDLNPTMSNQEIQKEYELIQQDKQQEHNTFRDDFNNGDFLGYQENENPAVDYPNKDFKERE